MAILQSDATLIQVGAEPVISVAQQMAFYLSVDEASIEFISVSPLDDSCTISAGGECWDVFYNPADSMVTDWITAE
jgi:hypothetical protein